MEELYNVLKAAVPHALNQIACLKIETFTLSSANWLVVIFLGQCRWKSHFLLMARRTKQTIIAQSMASVSCQMML